MRDITKCQIQKVVLYKETAPTRGQTTGLEAHPGQGKGFRPALSGGLTTEVTC